MMKNREEISLVCKAQKSRYEQNKYIIENSSKKPKPNMNVI